MICPNCNKNCHSITSYKNGKIRCENCMTLRQLKKNNRETRKAIKFLKNKELIK